METTYNIELDNATPLLGINNENLSFLKDTFPTIKFVVRSNTIKVIGSGQEFKNASNAIELCIDHVKKNNTLSINDIGSLLKTNGANVSPEQKIICHGINGHPIITKSSNQYRMVDLFEKNSLLFVTGPAGSGKTYVAIALAVTALKNKQVKRIILSRPVVEAGEKIGFLPGDIKEKIDPFLQPLYDALSDMLEYEKLDELMKKKSIQIVPLAFMRGRTLSDAVIILDEAQNATTAQLKMFLTRLGTNSKMILTGDLTQVDLPTHQSSGLEDAIRRLKHVKDIACIRFDQHEIIRHPLVKQIVDAYNKE